MTKPFMLLLLAMAGGLINPVDLKIQAQPAEPVKPKIAFTFDDGSIQDFGEYKLETWNQRLLDHLKKKQAQGHLIFGGCQQVWPQRKIRAKLLEQGGTSNRQSYILACQL